MITKPIGLPYFSQFKNLPKHNLEWCFRQTRTSETIRISIIAAVIKIHTVNRGLNAFETVSFNSV